jgi:hypothetical protein
LVVVERDIERVLARGDLVAQPFARALELGGGGEEELVVLEEGLLLVHPGAHVVDERIGEGAQARHQRVDVTTVGAGIRPFDDDVEGRQRRDAPIELVER